MHSQDKQPWNPFPLHALSARKKFGLSSRAMSVLIYLAARSNYTGWTCVGHKRICDDLGRSKDYVSFGLQELYEKQVVFNDRRNHHKSQADGRTLSPLLVPEEYRTSSSTAQDLTSESDLDSCPAVQDQTTKSSPVLASQVLPTGVKPYRIEPTGSQTHNLADSKTERVSECVSGSVASLPPVAPRTSTPTDKVMLVNQNGENVSLVMEAVYDLKPSESLLLSILESQPRFEWSDSSVSVISKVLATTYWKKKLQTPAQFAFAWSRTGPRCLYAQVLRDMPDTEPDYPEGEIDEEEEYVAS
jgi:hypothetical protein